MVIPKQKSHFICCPLLAVGAMKKISSHKIVFLKYWGAKIDILEKKKLHKQQLLEKVDKVIFFSGLMQYMQNSCIYFADV